MTFIYLFNLPKLTPRFYEQHRDVMAKLARPESDRVLFRETDTNLFCLSASRPLIDFFLLSDDLISVGDVYSFQLIANPTYKTDGKRLGIFNCNKQLEWLHRKLCGSCDVLSAVLEHCEWKRDRGISFWCASFSGYIEVTDVEKFIALITNGVGSAKGFGCGLFYLPKLMLKDKNDNY